MAPAIQANSNGTMNVNGKCRDGHTAEQRNVMDDALPIEITVEERGKAFAKDPWAHEYSVSEQALRDQERLIDQYHHKVLIVGAGHGGLLFAVRLLQTGNFGINDILIVDEAAGFGGTWYWNRYPGLMCDTESYIYMPLLEETGYMPREKYASGPELRANAERISHLWGLKRRALFRTAIKALDWNDAQGQWKATAQGLGKLQQVKLSADFAIIATGLYASPRIPDFPGLWNYKGPVFHPARWDYSVTGGTPERPEMTRLHNKRVAIVGTGASAVQIVPQLARHSKHLMVFQRTPSGVDQRDNCYTDKARWKEIASTKGWQRQRMENFNAFIGDPKSAPAVNMVGDRWTSMPSYSMTIGANGITKPGYQDEMREMDSIRQGKIRSRVHAIVHNPARADILSPNYPGWCKRPCFHDDYLAAFNEPNVDLVDLQGKGSISFTATGLAVADTQYEADVVIVSTGYTSPKDRSSPGSRANIAITGRGGLEMERKWESGLSTLHGVMTRDFPNLFFPGPAQSGVCTNQTYTLDQLARHVAYIMARGIQQCNGQAMVVEPSEEAERAWADQVVQRAGDSLTAFAACTSTSLFSAAKMTKDQIMNAARLTTWREGIASYVIELEAWRSEGTLQGLEIKRLA
uniref:FAD-binding monooxygenase andJ n=1 Tax=Emericella variicolor TaxID=1549217 RepID=ANDJ_EMEVA|nr:RecName: Full=FAD-binding monooxygenase andJ; AltName: Full=Anditomin synthesis protein J [Aspergillus stellatus]BAP81864.1 AndJ [Aspergillus stellatus]